jgi:hypothetical protein
MLDLYKGTVKMQQTAAEQERDAKAKADLKKTSTEKGGRTPPSSNKVFKRAELVIRQGMQVCRRKLTKPTLKGE